MKKVRIAMSLLLAVLAVSSFGQAEDAVLRKDMQKLYASWDGMVAKKDVKGLMSYLDKGFVGVDTEGNRMTYTESKDQLEMFFRVLRDVKTKTAVKHVRRQGPEAVAWVEMELTYKTQDNGKWVPMKVTMRFAETMKWTANGWRITYSQELPTNEPWDFGG
ncbi:MAG: nuclear transport factor 2 family protein [Fimbriimonadaceae bacterium]|nr:nuclear transport factor 2 family protein [Fimbriimonadaceae bacterium]